MYHVFNRGGLQEFADLGAQADADRLLLVRAVGDEAVQVNGERRGRGRSEALLGP